ncbi:MAG TPA: hypothetical protein PLU49_12900 [Saprospiraceae bacterium]|mgnify:CR=1 FL=1|nr:hypothetical protein [Saprospirales bacterium]HRQ30973.1 hypothetical protein [Saprospiraceae bacterium]
MNFNFLFRFRDLVDKNLNEYIKWVILVGLYGFYRMMAAVIEPSKIMFLIVPLIVLSFLVFTVDWILDSLVAVAAKKTTTTAALKRTGTLVAISLAAGLFGIIIFYLTEYIPFFNLGFLGLVSSALVIFWERNNPYFFLSLLLFAIGLIGLIFSFVQNSGVPFPSVIFYLGFTAFYFFRLYKNRIKKLPTQL